MWDSLGVLCNSKGAFETNRTLPGPFFRCPGESSFVWSKCITSSYLGDGGGGSRSLILVRLTGQPGKL